MNTKKPPNDLEVSLEPEIFPGDLRFLESEGSIYVSFEDLLHLADTIKKEYPELSSEAAGMRRILESLEVPAETVPDGVQLN